MYRFRFTYSRTRLQAIRGPPTLNHGRPIIPAPTPPGVNDGPTNREEALQANNSTRYQLSANNPLAIFENPEYHTNEVSMRNSFADEAPSIVVKIMRWIKLKIGWP